MRSSRPLPKETLAANLQHLMETRDWNPYDLARHSGVGQKTIWNIINQQSSPSLDTVDKLAAAFGLNLWHLIMPNLPQDMLSSPSIERLVYHYVHTAPDDRHLIEGIAERTASYRIEPASNDHPQNEPTGSDH